MKRAQPAKPATLFAEAEEHARDLLARRLAELKTLGPMLAQLDQLRPALKAKGLELYHTDISLTKYRPGGYNSREFKAIRLRTTGFWSSDESKVGARWLTALSELGFEIVHRSHGSGYSYATMRLGHLLIEIDAPTPPGSDTAEAARRQGWADARGAAPVYADGTPELQAYEKARAGAMQ